MGWAWADGATWAWEQANRRAVWAAKAAWDKRDRTGRKSESRASISFRGKAMKSIVTAFLTLFLLVAVPTTVLAQRGSGMNHGNAGGWGTGSGPQMGGWQNMGSGNWGSMDNGQMGQWGNGGWAGNQGNHQWGRGQNRNQHQERNRNRNANNGQYGGNQGGRRQGSRNRR